MVELKFLEVDLLAIKKYCEGCVGGKPYLTEIKRQSLEQPAKWYYFYIILQEIVEYKEYIYSNLKKYLSRSIEIATIFYMITEAESEDEKIAVEAIKSHLGIIKKAYRATQRGNIVKAVSYSGKTLNIEDLEEVETKK
jgi:hypothetical protein